MNDTGLLNACLFIPAENRGALLETFVLLELRKRQKKEIQTDAGRIRILPAWEWSLTQ